MRFDSVFKSKIFIRSSVVCIQKDEALLEFSLGTLSSRVQELKESIQAFLLKLEHEQMNW